MASEIFMPLACVGFGSCLADLLLFFFRFFFLDMIVLSQKIGYIILTFSSPWTGWFIGTSLHSDYIKIYAIKPSVWFVRTSGQM